MAGETQLHRTLKKEACRWLCRMGYRCIAAEVRLEPLGIIDAVGTGVFAPHRNYLELPRPLEQVCFIECKATRADFLSDRESNDLLRRRISRMQRRRRRRAGGGGDRPGALPRDPGKFDACLLQPLGNLHFVLAPAGIISPADLPPRWGLLSYSPEGVCIVVKAKWQESRQAQYVESAIARTLSGDIFRADDRAIASVNREIFAQQVALADRIRSIRPRAIYAAGRDHPGFSEASDVTPSRQPAG